SRQRCPPRPLPRGSADLHCANWPCAVLRPPWGPAGPQQPMGLSPGATGEGGLRLARLPRFRPKLSLRTAEESEASQALVQFSPEQPPQGPPEQGRSVQQGEKPAASLETAPNEKKGECNATPKPEGASKSIKQAVESKLRPQPGDLIEIFRIGYEHWAIYVEDDCVVHLAPPSEEFLAGSITSIFSNRAVVRYSRLEDVLHGCSWTVNNKLDGTYLPLPVDEIIQRTKNMVNKMVQYNLIEGNCEHFVNGLRYGVPRSQQVEHALVEGVKAAGAVISAVVDSIRPKALTA
ncbi:Phospholipase A and acyltransferase 5, partial [Galemys pyrenaicus]